MGVLGWDAERALATEPLAITLAYQGWEDQRYALERTLFAAQGIKTEPRPPRNATQRTGRDWDAAWRSFTREHNARWRASQRGERRASRRTGKPGKLKPGT